VRRFAGALGVEVLKARRSRVPWLTAAGFSLAPLMGGLFMVILKDPERARSMGLISAKAQLTVGVADWPSYLGLLAQATAVGGSLLFAFVTAWVFGREHADRTARTWLAVPTPRLTVVAAKLFLILIWGFALTALVLGIGLMVGGAVGIPGWSLPLLRRGAATAFVAAALTLALMPPVALLASAGRGYLLPLGWAILMLFLAQILAATGWGEWFPWSIPPLVSEVAGPSATPVGWISYALVALTGLAGTVATCAWWLRADHTH
jgi:ABC-2 type transport system permease protein